MAVVGEDDGCVVGEHKWIDSSFSASDAADAFEVMVDMWLELGSYGANTERGFTLAKTFLDPDNLGAGGCNEGFRRDDAALVTIHLSDEPEQSHFGWDDYVEWLQDQVPYPDLAQVHAVAGDYPGGCGWYPAGNGYWQATQATGGTFVGACEFTSWGDLSESAMRRLGEASVWDQASWGLALPAVPVTIQVREDGFPRADWIYDAEYQRVLLSEPPVPGATVEFTYRPVQDCEESQP